VNPESFEIFEMLPTMGAPIGEVRARESRSLSVPHTCLPRTSYGRRANIDPTNSATKVPEGRGRRGLMVWETPPESVLVIRKLDKETVIPFLDLVSWLLNEKGMTVYVEEKTLSDEDFHDQSELFIPMKSSLRVFKGYEGCRKLTASIDIIICLGGDGTLLYASSLFERSIPPIMSFNLGSLGFLTPFSFGEFTENLESLFKGNMHVLMRSRLEARVKNRNAAADTAESLNVALNEVVIDRGPRHNLGNLELYINDRLVTQVQGDGLIISTPTGSTAYALSAGAGMVHPLVPAILITPICPHSLSFRPIVVPSESRILIRLAPEARNSAFISYDGRSSTELDHSRDLIITTSPFSLPTVAKEEVDWFSTLQELMQWNSRVKQKAIITNNNKTKF